MLIEVSCAPLCRFRVLSRTDSPLVLDTWGSWEEGRDMKCPPEKQYLSCFPGANVDFKLSKQALSAGAGYKSSDRLRQGLRNRSVLFLGDSLTRYLATGLYHELGIEGGLRQGTGPGTPELWLVMACVRVLRVG